MRVRTKIYVDGASKSYNVKSLIMDSEEFKHEILVLDINDILPDYDDLHTGVKVRAIVQYGGASKEFVGYIHHVEPGDSKSYLPTKVVCVGASFVLKTQVNNVWQNQTGTSVISQILQENRISANVKPHKRVFPYLTQAGMSNWKFICNTAYTLGYVAYPVGASVHVIPRIQSWEDSRDSAHLLGLKRKGSFTQGSLLEFTAQAGDSMPADGELPINPVTVGIDPDGLNIIGSKADKKRATKRKPTTTLFEGSTKAVVNRVEDGDFESEAHRERTRFNLYGKARCIGNPDIGPGSVVYLSGIGDTFGGYWIVTKATHVVSASSYLLHLDLRTDSLGNDIKPPIRTQLDISLSATRVAQVQNMLIAAPKQVLPGMSVAFTDSNKWMGSTANLRSDSNIDKGTQSYLFNKMMNRRTTYGL